MRQWLVPGILAVGAVAAASGALTYQPSPSGPAGPIGPLPTPVVAARRMPVVLTTLVADERLAGRLDAVLDDPALGASRAASCMEVRVDGQVVYARQPTMALLPASNVKLLTSEAALLRLGGASHFTTSIEAAAPVRKGIINGPIWLVGGGDPLLITDAFRATETEFTWSREPGTRLEALADQIKAAGVSAITGGVVGDDSRYDSERAVPSWKPSYLADGEVGAVGALVVDGGFENATHHVPAASPATAAAAALTTLLQQRGVTVGGPPAEGRVAKGATTLASLSSLNLSQIVKVMLLESDNLSAEMLVKELGYRFGTGGSWASGLAVMRDTLAKAGIPLAGLALVDGSGLDRSDRATCDTLAAAVAAPGPVASIVDASLPVAAQTGTLAQRLVGQAAAGRLRAKTGSLTGVGALTGYIEPAGAASQVPPTLAPSFAVLANGLASDAAGRALEDRIADTLAAYPDAPPAASLAPG